VAIRAVSVRATRVQRGASGPAGERSGWRAVRLPAGRGRGQRSGWPWEPGRYIVYNSLYGCDSGCLYVRIFAECTCGWEYESGEFGEFLNEQEWVEFCESLVREANAT